MTCIGNLLVFFQYKESCRSVVLTLLLNQIRLAAVILFLFFENINLMISVKLFQVDSSSCMIQVRF